MNDDFASENTIPAVDKAVRLLLKLSEYSTTPSQKELARQLETTPSTLYRILCTLTKYGWTEKKANGGWNLSCGLLPVLLKLRELEPTWENTGDVLQNLTLETGLSSKYSFRRGVEQVIAARFESDGPFAVTGKIGGTFPLPEGSVGAALLCRTPESECLQLLAKTSIPIPEKKDPGLLLKAIAFCREHGYVPNIDSNRWNIGAISAPVFTSDGLVRAAVTCIGFRPEFTPDRVAVIGAALRRAAETLQTPKKEL